MASGSDVALSSKNPPALADCEQAALADLFGGDVELFLSFRSACLAQFPFDWSQARALLAQQQDWPALARLAHSLKGVLLTLGHADLAQAALELQIKAQTAVLGSLEAGAPSAPPDPAGQHAWHEAATLWFALQQQMARRFGVDLGPPVALPPPGRCV